MDQTIYHEQIADQIFCDRIKPYAIDISNTVEKVWGDYLGEQKPNWMKFADGSNSTKLYEAYNIFLCHYQEMTMLYEKIITSFKEKNPDTYKKYAISGWVNVYNSGGFLDWHTHGVGMGNAFDGRWHGYFCVNGEPSKTLYRDNETHKLVKAVENKNGWLTMSPGGMEHRVTPWDNTEEPRITIAFDIVPQKQIDFGVNHWMPIIKKEK